MYHNYSYDDVSKDVAHEMQRLIDLKRVGRFEESLQGYRILAEKENDHPLHYPLVLKGMAKVLVCLGRYEEAISTFEKACNHFRQINGQGEVMQCSSQASTVRERYTDKETFISYVRAASGGILDYPNNF